MPLVIYTQYQDVMNLTGIFSGGKVNKLHTCGPFLSSDPAPALLHFQDNKIKNAESTEGVGSAKVIAGCQQKNRLALATGDRFGQKINLMKRPKNVCVV